MSGDGSQLLLLGVHWTSWMFKFVSFIKFGQSSSIIFSNTLSALLFLVFLGLPQCICWTTWWWHRSLRLCWLCSIYFLFLRLDNFHCLIFKLMDSFACSKLSLSPFSEFLISIIVLFSFGEFFKLFFLCYISILSHIILIFSISFFSTLNIFLKIF